MSIRQTIRNEMTTESAQGAGIRAELLAVLDEAGRNEKPWLQWPSTWHSFEISKPHQVLHRYLTDPIIQRERLKEVRQHFLNRAAAAGLCKKGSALLLEGGRSDEWYMYASDCNKAPFRQEQFFQYLLGINEPDILALVDLNTGDFVVFVPKTPEESQRFLGPRRSSSWYCERYGISKAFEVEGTEALQAELENHDSGRKVEPPKALSYLNVEHVDDTLLYDLLAEARVFKTPLEQEHLAAACLCSSMAHCFVMSHMKAGMIEGQGEALFKAFVGFVGGARHVAYDCICCSGENASILHYGHAGRPNDAEIGSADLLLYDMGGDFNGYATDITVTFPASGIFSPEQRGVYEAVLDAQRQVLSAMKPGVRWTEMHRLAEHVILKHLKALGILTGSVEECEAAGLGAVFMPHGLGHLMGIDTHDVGGFTQEWRPSSEEGLKYLRTTRVLERGMCITVEPGCYFIDFLIAKAANDPNVAPLINMAQIDRFRPLGGVRLEDDVLITDVGVKNLTIKITVLRTTLPQVVPRLVGDVEGLLQCSRNFFSDSGRRPVSELSQCQEDLH